jgi:HK97 family phage major capsid protein
MANVKALLETGCKLAAEIKRQAEVINADNRDFTSEERAAWDKANEDYNAIEAQVTAAKRAAAIPSRMSLSDNPPRTQLYGADDLDIGQSRGNDKDSNLAFAAWALANKGANLPRECTEAAQRLGVNLKADEIVLKPMSTEAYRRARNRFNLTPVGDRQNFQIGASTMTVGTGSAGGYFIPTTLLDTLETNLLYYGPMRIAGDVIRTATGDTMNWPTMDDTGNVGEQLAEEGSISGSGASTSPTVAQIQFLAYKFSAKPVKLSSELLQDSIFDAATIIGEALGERLGRITNTKFTTGAGHGSSTCEGFLTAAAAGVTSGATTTFNADDLVKLFHSVDVSYRVGASFMAHDSVISYMRQLKTGDGVYLWRSGLEQARPDQLLGCPVFTNNDLSSTFTTGQKLVAFGNFKKFKIRDAGGIRIVRLNELYADADQIGFNAYQRCDSRLLNAGTNPIKYLKLM